MTELQKTEFELLRQALKICEELDIKCYLICGTALGAVKYNGFIPWDDDIDIGMYRKDYELFCREAPGRLKSPFFLQNYKTDPSYPLIFSKLRNSRTTYIEDSIKTLNINHGVYIDIFPLDLYPCGKASQILLEVRKWYYTHLLATVYDTKRRLPGEMIKRFNLIIGVHKRIPKIIRKYEKMLSKYRDTDSHTVCNHGNWQGRLEYSAKEQYGNGFSLTFEGAQAIVPEQYDAYLTQKYGDWRAELPKEEQVGHHYYAVMDLERPYTDYTEVISEQKIRVRKVPKTK